MNEDNIKYEKLDYSRYEKRINDSLNNYELQRLGIRKNKLGYTKYGYELAEYVIGNGEKDIFIVGGTHGSEIIGVDFVSQLLNNVNRLDDYDPNIITLHFIPNQNPEGFDITTQMIKGIDDSEFTKESKDYYLRYRTDNLLNDYLSYLNNQFSNLRNTVITPQVFVNILKDSFKSSLWLNLIEPVRGVPEMINFQNILMALPIFDSFSNLKNNLLPKIYNARNISSRHSYYKYIMDRLAKSIFSDELLFNIDKNNNIEINKSLGFRLYQEKFKNTSIEGTKSKQLSSDVQKSFKENDIFNGSLIKFDPNGDFINLNKNRIDNPGVQKMIDNVKSYGPSPANNIIDNSIGPIGKPCVNPNNFKYAYENIVLINLLEKSNELDRLKGVLLYHGTGALVYSKPYYNGKSKELFDKIFKYNEQLSESYKDKTGYKQVLEAENTGVGDLLRQTYPGVLLVELSKMVGNPIAPYGDMDNYNCLMHDNFSAVNNIIKKCIEMRCRSL